MRPYGSPDWLFIVIFSLTIFLVKSNVPWYHNSLGCKLTQMLTIFPDFTLYILLKNCTQHMAQLLVWIYHMCTGSFFKTTYFQCSIISREKNESHSPVCNLCFLVEIG